ncbi:MAG TPA: ABC transporter ATP-binding protein [Baekduia sp.]
MTRHDHDASQPAPAVEIRGLTKHYGDRAAVDAIDLTVRVGDVYGFLGPNGAGKTTTLRMLLGLVKPQAGTIRLLGRDPVPDPIAAREGVAGFIEEPRLYTYLSGRRNLELLADFDLRGEGRAAIDEALDLVDLRDRADDKVGHYSQGMRQRIGIAACLVRRPRLLILDEPANGVDPGGVRDMRILLRRLAGEGITILLSSHLLAEVEETCSRVAVISGGRIAFEGDLAELQARSITEYVLETTDPERALRVCFDLGLLHDLRGDGPNVRFTAATDEALVALTTALGAHGIGVRALRPERRSLEDVFFELTEPSVPEPAGAVA